MKANATFRNRFVWSIPLVVFATVLISPLPAQMTPAHALGGICSNSSTGLVPLTDGIGLYDTGNDMPVPLANAAPAITPIGGVVGLVSLGMSNTSQEWGAFMTLVNSSGDVAADVRIADGAIAGKTMAEWAVDSGGVWSKSVSRISDGGLSADQVQVVWMKMGSKLEELAPTEDERIAQERQWLESVITRASDTFPNLKRIYISSRTYAGYASNGNHAEPETGWDNGLSVRTVVADSLAGQTAVWTAWGPYLWADGISGRSDGLIWECEDFEDDGVHPSVSGEAKVAGLLWDFFAGDPTACEWFLSDQSQCGAIGGGGGAIPGHFDDVPADHTFFDDVEWLARSGITLGCNPPDDTLFCPNDPVTRGQMAAFLDRALDLPDAPDAFTDDAGSVFEGSINAIAGADITQGCNPPQNTRFCLNDPVTRGQMAAFLVRALGLPAGPDVFTDDDGSVFEADIQALARSGITYGCNPPVNDRFCPGQAVTRAEMAAFLHRAEPFLP
jgi:hypothetical protein